MRLLTDCLQWFRITFSWSNSWQSWKERLGTLGVLLLAVGLFWLRSRLTPAQQVVAWLLLAVLLAALMRRGWLKLFGPVLFYDMVRVSRRSRYFIFRALYVTGLLLILSWVWLVWRWDYNYMQGGNAIRMMAAFAEVLFYTFMIVQLSLSAILTPAYVAGSIAEEKDRKTLEFLLATDLRNREIVLSKLAARIANLMMIVLAGLPVLAFLQFFGGIDPDLLLASFAATVLIILSLAGVSMLCSVHSKKPRDAIILTYLLVVAYHCVAFLAFVFGAWLGKEFPGLLDIGINVPWLGTADEPYQLTLMAPFNALNAGNLPLALGQIGMGLDRGQLLSDLLPDMLRDFAIFHGLIALTTTVLAVLRLRRVALKETYGENQKLALHWRIFGRPGVGNQPMLWKEIFAEPGLRFRWLGKIMLGILVLLSFLPICFIFLEFYRSAAWMNGVNYNWRREQFHEAMNVFVRSVGTIVASLGLLAVAVRAAGSLSGERDKQTLDGLLTSPLDASTILFAKWAGSIASIRWLWVWLGGIWLVGLIGQGLHVLAVPFVLAAWLVYAGVFAAIGLWYSLVCRTTLRATMWTLLTTVFVGGGHWVVWLFCCLLPMEMSRSYGGNDLEYLAKFGAGQTPPAVLVFLSFYEGDFKHTYRMDDEIELIGFSILGLGTWTMAGLVLGTLLHHRFREMTLRDDSRRPERWYTSQSAPFTLATPAAPPATPILEAVPVLDEWQPDHGPTTHIQASREPQRPD
ncbi:MAG: ABC transporter permease subunit [Planctomycetia bacterium]|nr:ABC transporter permease subunit [Planctomycetia bacterium]